MTKQQVANGMLKDFPWDGSELTAPLTLPGALLAPSYVEQKIIATPANPPAGSLRLYPKSDGKYYQLDSAGNEQIISGQTQAQNDARYLPLTGGTLTGSLTVQGSVTGQSISSSGQVTADGVVANTYKWTPASDGESLYKEMPGRLRLGGAMLTVDQNLNIGSYLQFAEIATPVTPNTGFLRLYGKSDHKLYFKDTSGTETPLVTKTQADASYDALGAASTGDNAHVAATDPHPIYLTAAEGDARYAVISGGPGGTYLTDVQADQRYIRQDGTKSMTADLITTGVGSTGTNNFPIKTNSVTRWFVNGTNYEWTPGADNIYDIGDSAARPRTLTLGTSLIIGGTNNFFRVRPEPNLATAYNIEHVPTGSIFFLPTTSGSFGAGIWMSYNALFDGTAMVPMNVSSSSAYFNIYSGGVSVAYAAASATPAFQWLWGLTPTANFSASMWLGGASSTIQRYNGTGANVFQLTNTTGYVSLSSAGIAAAGIQMTSNAYYDGTAWNRVDTVNPIGHFNVSAAGLTFYTAVAGSGAPAFLQRFNLDANGNLSTSGYHSISTGTISGQVGQIRNNDFGVGSRTSSNWLRFSNNQNICFWMNDGGFTNDSPQITFDTSGSIAISGSMSAYSGGVWSNAFYLGGSGSYYINVSSNVMQAVNMNIQSWGWIALSANGGIRWEWNGWMHCPNQVLVDGVLQTQSRLVTNSWDNGGANSLGGELYVNGGITLNSGAPLYMESGRNVYMQWRGDLRSVYVPYDLGLYTTRICLSRIDWEGSRQVYFNWDGSNVTMNMSGPWGFGAPNLFAGTTNTMNIVCSYGAAGGYICFQDTNVRIYRPANIMYLYAYDAQWAFIRTYDGFNCGYVDGGGFHNTSSLRYKKDISVVTNGLDLVMDSRVRPIRYTIPGLPKQNVEVTDDRGKRVMKPMAAQAHTYAIGFGAEDMAPVIPEAVSYDDKGPNSINYSSLIPVLWDAVRTLNNKVEELEGKLACQ